MFGNNRRKVTEHVIERVRPLIALMQHHHGLPSGFWTDPFVLGFIGFMISFHGSYTSGKSLSQADKGLMLYDSFTALSNMNGQSLGRQFMALQAAKDRDFEQGGDFASYCAFVSIGKMTPGALPYFEKARDAGGEMGTRADIGEVAARMLKMLWLDKLSERFSLDSKLGGT